MAEAGNERAKKAFELAENPNEMFSTIQIGITLVGILTGLYSGATFSGPLEDILVASIPSIEPYAASISSFLIVAIITYLSLVIGELVPKRLALIVLKHRRSRSKTDLLVVCSLKANR